MSLTIQLLIKDNERTLEKSILSILPLKSHIKAVDFGSKDDSLEICRKHNIQVIRLQDGDRSKIRNEMMGDGWNFYIQPWEVLISGHEYLVKLPPTGPLSYYIDIYQGQVVTRDIRLWRDLTFRYPIFETIIDRKAQKLGEVIIWSDNPPKRDILPRIEEWKSKSGSIEPLYYEAWAMLQDEKYDSFVAIATHYLSLDSHSKSAVMLRYYLAQIQAYINKEMGKATRNILPCIVAKPLMAEFWCLLGDILYSRKKYKKAREFYENAVVLGERRKGDDDWPVEIAKYKEYPDKMIASCREMVAGTKLFGPQKVSSRHLSH